MKRSARLFDKLLRNISDKSLNTAPDINISSAFLSAFDRGCIEISKEEMLENLFIKIKSSSWVQSLKAMYVLHSMLKYIPIDTLEIISQHQFELPIYSSKKKRTICYHSFVYGYWDYIRMQTFCMNKFPHTLIDTIGQMNITETLKMTMSFSELLSASTILTTSMAQCFSSFSSKILQNIIVLLDTDLSIIYEANLKLIEHIIDLFAGMEFPTALVGYYYFDSFKKCTEVLMDNAAIISSLGYTFEIRGVKVFEYEVGESLLAKVEDLSKNIDRDKLIAEFTDQEDPNSYKNLVAFKKKMVEYFDIETAEKSDFISLCSVKQQEQINEAEVVSPEQREENYEAAFLYNPFYTSLQYILNNPQFGTAFYTGSQNPFESKISNHNT